MAKDKTQAGRKDEAVKAARGPGDRSARWRGTTTWPVVLAEGIVLAAVGAVMWLPPSLDARTMLQILGIAVLATAIISAWRLLRGVVEPIAVALVAFRAGIGLTVGALVVIGSLIVEQTAATTLAIAVVLGVGLILYGFSVLAGPIVERVPDAPFPLGTVALAVGFVVIGAFLVIRANAGVEALTETFSFLGLLLGATGMALVGYALILKPYEDGTAR